MLLQKGDTVRIIAPGSPCPKEELVAAIEYLESIGLKAKYSKAMMRSKGYLANTDEYRAHDFIDAMKSADAKVVWAIRGGYGCLRILPYLGNSRAPIEKKVLVGLSDISILQQFVINHWKQPCIHGPVLSRFGSDRCNNKEKKAMKDLLLGDYKKSDLLSYEGLTVMNNYQNLKEVKGKIVGGNLVSLASCLGSEYAPVFKNRIVFIEEVNERGYVVDRWLKALLLGSDLLKARAVVFGHFIGGDEPNGSSTVAKALNSFAAQMRFPVLKGMQLGHGKTQLPLIFNTNSKIEISKSKGRISCQRI
ncbi:MAG: LD-carboxypeptidase [Bdellovibrionota bacterium]|nr:LD-carboxypeptidase [Bdellovibrionota bacterium]